MQRNGRSYKPVLLAGTPAPLTAAGTPVMAAEQKQFVVEVQYTSTTGTPATYSGRFYAMSASLAEGQARGFVTKYLRPAQISGTLVQPVT